MLREDRKQHFCAHIVYPRCLLTRVFKNQGTELQILPGHGHAVHGVTKIGHDWLTKQQLMVNYNIPAPCLSMIFLPFLSWRGGPLSHLLALFSDSGCSTDQWLESSWYTESANLALFLVSPLVLHCLVVLDRELFTPTLKSYGWVPGIFYLKL